MSRPVFAKRHTAPSAATFTSVTTTSSFSRPLLKANATRQVPFTDKTSLSSAISNMQAGDYIYYNGTGVLTINTTTAVDDFSISNKNPASITAIDFGTPNSTSGQIAAWAGSTSANYVKFTQNHTSAVGYDALFVGNCSNLAIYGGEFTSTANGINMNGALNNVYLLDAWIHDVGGTGIRMIPSTSSGAVATIQNTTVRVEVGPNFCMNPAIDNHADKGTGMHCALLFDSGNGSNFENNTIAIYGHDSLQAGATSYGQTWPEGGGGSCIEIGQSTGVGTALGSGNTLYAKAVNFYMTPNGTNPGSTGTQTGGNCFNLWGNIPLTNLTLGWAEGSNITGAVVNGNSNSGWHSAPISVTHGRSHGGAGVGTNLYTGGGNGAPNNVPYPTFSDVTYNDCT